MALQCVVLLAMLTGISVSTKYRLSWYHDATKSFYPYPKENTALIAKDCMKYAYIRYIAIAKGIKEPQNYTVIGEEFKSRRNLQPKSVKKGKKRYRLFRKRPKSHQRSSQESPQSTSQVSEDHSRRFAGPVPQERKFPFGSSELEKLNLCESFRRCCQFKCQEYDRAPAAPECLLSRDLGSVEIVHTSECKCCNMKTGKDGKPLTNGRVGSLRKSLKNAYRRVLPPKTPKIIHGLNVCR